VGVVGPAIHAAVYRRDGSKRSTLAMWRNPARAVRITPCRSTSSRSCHCSSLACRTPTRAECPRWRSRCPDTATSPSASRRTLDRFGGPHVDLDDQTLPAGVVHLGTAVLSLLFRCAAHRVRWLVVGSTIYLWHISSGVDVIMSNGTLGEMAAGIGAEFPSVSYGRAHIVVMCSANNWQ
jgi:hypothetical protein